MKEKLNDFLMDQIINGNIKYTEVGFKVQTSSLLKDSTYEDKKRFKDKITAYLRKCGYFYVPMYDTYIPKRINGCKIISVFNN